MYFNSLTFLLFFASVLFLYNLAFSWRFKKYILLVASYLFYAAWNPPFVVLLWISTLVDWFVAKRIYAAKLKSNKLFYILISLFVNLGLLGFFKYGEFFLNEFRTLMALGGVSLDYATPDIILPIGISFYTFQTISYTIDVFRKEVKPAKQFIDYALYVTFFPQLVAGPIVRAATFLPQCISEKKLTLDQYGWGFWQITLGLFMKVFLADGIFAPIANHLYVYEGIPSMLSAWCGTIAFAFQIYFDFAGYSMMAIGIAFCLGFVLPQNFNYPYASCGFSDFWQRWHISLSSWLRDYLYISLGGNRVGISRNYINLMLTMLIGGLWHGASWTFVVWGGLHGMYLILERVLKHFFRGATKWVVVQVGVIITTFLLVCIAWVFFRASSFDQAFLIIRAMFLESDLSLDIVFSKMDILTCLSAGGVILLTHFFMRKRSMERLVIKAPWAVRSLILSIMLFFIIVFPGTNASFLYFQF